eukprot:scaffold17087_cov22-Tisochrysis_lutea.AAC.2
MHCAKPSDQHLKRPHVFGLTTLRQSIEKRFTVPDHQINTSIDLTSPWQPVAWPATAGGPGAHATRLGCGRLLTCARGRAACRAQRMHQLAGTPVCIY